MKLTCILKNIWLGIWHDVTGWFEDLWLNGKEICLSIGAVAVLLAGLFCSALVIGLTVVHFSTLPTTPPLPECMGIGLFILAFGGFIFLVLQTIWCYFAKKVKAAKEECR